MTSAKDLDVPWIEIQFLVKASDILCKSRQTLMYTYVFAFYQEKSNQVICLALSVKSVNLNF